MSTTMYTDKPFEINVDELFDIDLCNQPYDFSSPVREEVRPSFMEPKPVSPKRSTLNKLFGKSNKFFNQSNKFFNQSNKFSKPVLKRRADEKNNIELVAGKRSYEEAFPDSFEDERYNQHIASDFFTNNVGHSVVEGRRERDSESKYDPEEILQWCQYYLANRNLFNV